MPSFDLVIAETDQAVATLTLNDPDRLNPLGTKMLNEIAAAARWLDGRPEVKVIVVRGAGRAFTAGADVTTFTAEVSAPEARAAADTGRQMAATIEGLRAVTIAQIHGYCIGGGVVLAAACDLRLAADDTTFSIPEVDIGIPLAWGGIPRLVREIGPARTKELVMTCRPFSAAEAMAAGFVNRVVAASELAAVVEDLAGVLTAKPSLALGATKRHVNAVTEQMVGLGRSWSDADAFVTAMADPEARAAASAYLEAMRRR